MGVIYKPEPGASFGHLIATVEETGESIPVYDPQMAQRLVTEQGGSSPSVSPLAKGPGLAPPSPETSVADALRTPPKPPAVPVMPQQAQPAQPQQQRQQAPAPQQPQQRDPYAALSQLPKPPPGMVTSKVEVTPDTPGAPYDRQAEERRGEDLLDRRMQIQQQQEAQDMLRNEQQIELGRQKEESQQKATEEKAKVDRYDRELETVVNTEINPNRLKENQSLFGSILGIVGMTLASLSRDPNVFENYRQAMDRRIDRDIAVQKEQKESAISRLTKSLGSSQQAEAHYRANVTQLGMQTMQARLEKLGVAEQYQEQMNKEAERTQALNDAARAASVGKPGAVSVEFGQPPAAKGAGALVQRGPVTEQLKALGVSPEAYRTGLTRKVGQGGEGAPTVASTAQFVKRLDDDIAALQSLTVDGVMPQKILVNKLSGNIRDALATAGVEFSTDGTVDAQQVQQLYTRRLIAEAKRMGGVITENDLKFTERVAGSTPEAVMGWMQRMREDANREMVASLGADFPDYTQQVADIMLRGQSGTSGVPGVKSAQEFEVQSAPPAAPQLPKPDADPQRQPGAYNAKPKPKAEKSAAELRREEERRRRREEADALMANESTHGYGR